MVFPEVSDSAASAALGRRDVEANFERPRMLTNLDPFEGEVNGTVSSSGDLHALGGIAVVRRGIGSSVPNPR